MTITEYLLLAAHVITGGAFFAIGVRNISKHGPLTGLMSFRGLPFPALTAAFGIGMQIVFGGMMVLQVMTLVAALGLAAFVVLATAIAHWPFGKTGPELDVEISACLANAIMLGGLLGLAAVELAAGV